MLKHRTVSIEMRNSFVLGSYKFEENDSQRADYALQIIRKKHFSEHQCPQYTFCYVFVTYGGDSPYKHGPSDSCGRPSKVKR